MTIIVNPRTALLVGLLLSVATPAAAEAPFGEHDRPEARGSIYRLNLPLDIPVTAAGAFGTAVPYLMSSLLVDPKCPCDGNNVNLLDRGSVGNHDTIFGIMGDVTVGVAAATPVAFELLTQRSVPTLIEDLGVYTEVVAVNGGLVALAKFTVQRPTPRAYGGDPQQVKSPGGYLSFYSGHTSFTFAALSFTSMTIGVRYDQWVWPWVVTTVIGGAVAAAMVMSGAHFPTDVMMGALAGTVVGVSIPVLHLRARHHPSLRVAAMPGGLALRGRF